MPESYTFNGECVHLFEATDEGLVCKECGHVLPLVEIQKTPLERKCETEDAEEAKRWGAYFSKF